MLLGSPEAGLSVELLETARRLPNIDSMIGQSGFALHHLTIVGGNFWGTALDYVWERAHPCYILSLLQFAQLPVFGLCKTEAGYIYI